jgi:ribosomal protein S4
MRINKFIASRLGITRREADALVAHGFVTSDSEELPPGYIVRSTDSIDVDYQGSIRSLTLECAPVILVNKPINCSTILNHKVIKGKQTVWDLLPKAYTEYLPLGGLGFEEDGIVIMVRDKAASLDNESTQKYLCEITSSPERLHEIDGILSVEVNKHNPSYFTITRVRKRTHMISELRKHGITPTKVTRIADGAYTLHQLQDNQIFLEVYS